jgi:hypothetical protein
MFLKLLTSIKKRKLQKINFKLIIKKNLGIKNLLINFNIIVKIFLQDFKTKLKTKPLDKTPLGLQSHPFQSFTW